MGCGCGGARARTSATLTPAQVRAEQARIAAAAASRPAGANQANQLNSTPPMRGRTQTFSLALSDGQTLTFGSRLEAEAENVRLGYRGRVIPVT